MLLYFVLWNSIRKHCPYLTDFLVKKIESDILIEEVAQALNKGLVVLSILGVLASVISAYYYLRIIKVMYFDEINSNINYNLSISYKSKFILIFLILIMTFFVFYPSLLISFASSVDI